MLRWVFIGANGVWGIYHLQAGLRAALTSGAAWDAGVLDLFMAFWMLFAAAGFHRRNFWLVSMAALVLTGMAGLSTLILVAGDFQRQAGLSDDGRLVLAGTVARLGLMAAGWLYALVVHRRGGDSG